MFILTKEQVRKIEEKANSIGLSYKEMMEKAGHGCADFILSHFPEPDNIVILCGKGKNGGDGFVTARYLAEAGKKVTVIRLFEEPSDWLSDSNFSVLPNEVNKTVYYYDRRTAQDIIRNAQIVVDAVFGIGFKGELPRVVSEVFGLVNRINAVKIAIDIPSGLTVTQTPDNNIFKADYTLSMLALKPEHIYNPYRSYCGAVRVISIGFNLSSYAFPQTFTLNEVKNILPERPFASHKGTFGKTMIIAGSRNMPGAAVIAAKGAINTGVGLAQLAFPSAASGGIVTKLNETVFLPFPSDEYGEFTDSKIEALLSNLTKCNSVAFGCGIGLGESSRHILCSLLSYSDIPLIIDADGLNLLSEHKDILRKAKCPVLLTPHPGEMARLTNLSIETVNSDRIRITRAFASQYNVYVLLKGANTVVAAPNGDYYINSTGSSALARAASGDLLTGIAASLSAQGLSPFDTLCAAAFIHGLTGEIAEKKYTAYSSTVERLIDTIPDAFLKITESK